MVEDEGGREGKGSTCWRLLCWSSSWKPGLLASREAAWKRSKPDPGRRGQRLPGQEPGHGAWLRGAHGLPPPPAAHQCWTAPQATCNHVCRRGGQGAREQFLFGLHHQDLSLMGRGDTRERPHATPPLALCCSYMMCLHLAAQKSKGSREAGFSQPGNRLFTAWAHLRPRVFSLVASFQTLPHSKSVLAVPSPIFLVLTPGKPLVNLFSR